VIRDPIGPLRFGGGSLASIRRLSIRHSDDALATPDALVNVEGTASVEDLLVRAEGGTPPKVGVVHRTSTVTAHRAALSGTLESGWTSISSVVDIEDLYVADVDQNGLVYWGGTVGRVRRFHVARVRLAGLRVGDYAQVHAEDLRAESVGNGLTASEQAETSLDRADITPGCAGIRLEKSARCTASDLVVSGKISPCLSGEAEHGASTLVLDESQLDMERFRLLGVANWGVLIMADAVGSVGDGRIANSDIGLCSERLSNELPPPLVAFGDNRVNLQEGGCY
jgi:hypothetical protein